MPGNPDNVGWWVLPAWAVGAEGREEEGLVEFRLIHPKSRREEEAEVWAEGFVQQVGKLRQGMRAALPAPSHCPQPLAE